MSTILVDGIERPIHNAEGRLIHQTEEGLVNFWRWFGNSQGVDRDGRPKVYYHGTGVWELPDRQLGDVREFNRRASSEIGRRRPSLDHVGVWFSDNPGPGGAEMYAGRAGVIYPVYLRFLDYKRTTFNQMARTAFRLGHGEPPEDEMAKPTEIEPYRHWLREAGYDSIQIFHDVDRDDFSTEFREQTVIVVLEPHQIKSAIGNSGRFCQDSACIDDHLPPKKQLRKQADNEMEISP